MTRPKKTYEQMSDALKEIERLETELKRVKAKSSARKRNLQGLNKTIESYVAISENQHNRIVELLKQKTQSNNLLETIAGPILGIGILIILYKVLTFIGL